MIQRLSSFAQHSSLTVFNHQTEEIWPNVSRLCPCANAFYCSNRKFLFSTSISYSYTSHNMKLRHEKFPCNETPHSCDVINAFWKKMFNISHGLGLDMIFIQWILCFLSPSLDKWIEYTQRVGQKSYPTLNHGRFFLSHAITPLSSLHFSNDANVPNVISTVLRYNPLWRHRSGIWKNVIFKIELIIAQLNS